MKNCITAALTVGERKTDCKYVNVKAGKLLEMTTV